MKIKQSIHVPARAGKVCAVRKGDLSRIADLRGRQPVDFRALDRCDASECLSCEHTKPSIEKLYPHRGDAAYTTRRRPIVTLIEDRSPGQPAMPNRRCRFHGGKSTGPTTAEGLARARAARLVHGGCSAEIIDLQKAAVAPNRQFRDLVRPTATAKRTASPAGHGVDPSKPRKAA